MCVSTLSRLALHSLTHPSRAVSGRSSGDDQYKRKSPGRGCRSGPGTSGARKKGGGRAPVGIMLRCSIPLRALPHTSGGIFCVAPPLHRPDRFPSRRFGTAAAGGCQFRAASAQKLASCSSTVCSARLAATTPP